MCLYTRWCLAVQVRGANFRCLYSIDVRDRFSEIVKADCTDSSSFCRLVARILVGANRSSVMGVRGKRSWHGY